MMIIMMIMILITVIHYYFRIVCITCFSERKNDIQTDCELGYIYIYIYVCVCVYSLLSQKSSYILTCHNCMFGFVSHVGNI